MSNELSRLAKKRDKTLRWLTIMKRLAGPCLFKESCTLTVGGSSPDFIRFWCDNCRITGDAYIAYRRAQIALQAFRTSRTFEKHYE